MRTKHAVLALLLVASFTLTGAGCGKKPAGSTNGTASKISDACGNPYYPFTPGLAIAYSVSPSSGAVGDSDYTYRIVSVTGTTAAVRAEMASGAVAEMTADCASGSVALKGSSSLGAAMKGVEFKTTILSSNGTFMPANVAVGSTWSNEEKVKMEITGGPTAGMGPITMTTKESSRAVSEESVTVPAGTYTAIKVEVTRTTTSEIASGFKIPASTSTATEWWVKGIGMVKSETKSEGVTSTIEAKFVTGV